MGRFADRHHARAKPGRGVSRPRRRIVAGLTFGIVALLAALSALASSANAKPSTKYYSISVAPMSSGTGETHTYTFTLTNCGTGSAGCSTNVSTQSFASANIAVPGGFVVTGGPSVAPPAGQTWTACLGDGSTCGASPNNVVQVRGTSSSDAIAPGQWLTVSLTARAPCATGDYTWASQVKQSNNFNGPPGNDFARVGSDAVVHVSSSGPPTHYTISLPSSPFTATAGTSFTPTVTAYDSCNNPANLNGAAGSLSGNLGTASEPAPDGTAPSYGTVTFTSGVAHPSVTAYKAETGRTLTFTPPTGTAVTTSTFTVVAASPDHLDFTTQPNVGGSSSWPLYTGSSLTAFNTAVALVDHWGNVATQVSSGTVSLALNASDGSLSSATLGGTTSLAPTAGVASFTGLTVDQSSIGYTLTASYGSLTGTSAPFNVYAAFTTCSGPCSTDTTTIGTGTNQVTGTDGFLFIGIAGETLGSTPAGCQSFTPLNPNDVPIVVLDQRSSLDGELYVTEGVRISDIQSRYGSNNGQQFIPICAGAMRIAQHADGTTYPVPCNDDYDGHSQTGWWGKTLDSSGLFVDNSFTQAACDPGTGYFFGILASFQDYRAPSGSPTIDPASNPTVSGWTTDPTGTYRLFTIRYPVSSVATDPYTGEATSSWATSAPWDGLNIH